MSSSSFGKLCVLQGVLYFTCMFITDLTTTTPSKTTPQNEITIETLPALILIGAYELLFAGADIGGL